MTEEKYIDISKEVDKIETLAYALEGELLNLKCAAASKEYHNSMNLLYCLMDQMDNLRTEVAMLFKAE